MKAKSNESQIYSHQSAQGSIAIKALGISLILFASPTQAVTFTVTNLNDSGAGSLRQAILDANTATATDDEIVFDTGLSGILLTTGGFSISGNLIINGPGANVLTISGNNTRRIFTVNQGITSTISNLTIKNGGLYNNQGTLTVNNSTISDSRLIDGGGISNYDGTLTINNCLIANNSVSDDGGGIYNYGGNKTVTINNSSIVNNTASSNGGAIYNSADLGTINVINSTLDGNSAGSGGGIYIYGGTMTVKASTLSGNSSTRSGGGIYNYLGLVNVLNSTLSNNSYTGTYNGYGGAGIYTNSTLFVLSSTLSNNSAGFGEGGGIFIERGGVSIGNSILAGNRAFKGSDVSRYSGTFTSQGNNLFGENGASGLLGASPIASDIILANPIGMAIGPLTNNGGPTLTHLPIAGSPAINAGNNLLIPAGTSTDQRGSPRISGGKVDIGSVEIVAQPGDYNPLHSDFNADGKDDLAGLTSANGVYYSVNLSAWTPISGQLSKLIAADFNGDGYADLAGLASNGGIYYSTNLRTWATVPGILNKLVAGDFNGDGKADLAGLTSNGLIYYSTNLSTWNYIPGLLSQLRVGDINGDGRDDLLGLASNNTIWYTVNLASWNNPPGILSQIVLGDFNNDGKADLAGLSNNNIFYTTNFSSWNYIPGQLNQLVATDLNDDGRVDLAGIAGNGTIWYTTNLRSWTNMPGILNTLAD